MLFFDRELECKDLWRLFRKNQNVLMLAPRRIGKTMLLHQIADKSEDNGFRGVVVDVEGYSEEKDFFQQLCSSIQEEIGTGRSLISIFTNRLKLVIHGSEDVKDWRQLLLNTDWQRFAETLICTLNESGGDQPLLVMIDELAIFIMALLRNHGLDRAKSFLYWLRNMQQKYRNVRWLYTGSIGLDAVARREGMEGALVDMEVYPLQPFAEDTARKFLKHLSSADNCQIQDEAVEIILQGLGWLSPYYLDKIVSDACSQVGMRGQVTPIVAGRALEAMLDRSKRVYWSPWREHLDKNFSEPERTNLYTALEVIATDPIGARRDTILVALNKGGETIGNKEIAFILDTLTTDGYITFCDGEPGRYRFVMNLLRLWWQRYVICEV
jgi:hypothetical protein